MLYGLMLGGWILVAAVCAVVLGKAVRSAEAHERPAPVVPASLPTPSPAEERGYVQGCLFDTTAPAESAEGVHREPVAVS